MTLCSYEVYMLEQNTDDENKQMSNMPGRDRNYKENKCQLRRHSFFLRGRGAEGEGENESQADSLLGTEPNVGLTSQP